MKTLVRLLSSICMLSLLYLTVGCGPQGHSKVTGKVIQGGAPLKVSDKGVIQVSLMPVDSKGDDANTAFGTTVNSDGTFSVNKGADGNFPRTGKYKVGVQVYDPYPGEDKFKGKFVLAKSSLVADVNGNGEITVDLGK